MAKDRQFFLREWRKHRGYSQERLADMTGMSKGYISELESGSRRYNEDLLEKFAEALRCSPADLIMRDPTREDAIWSIWETLDTVQRQQVVGMAKVIKGSGTGTDG